MSALKSRRNKSKTLFDRFSLHLQGLVKVDVYVRSNTIKSYNTKIKYFRDYDKIKQNVNCWLLKNALQVASNALLQPICRMLTVVDRGVRRKFPKRGPTLRHNRETSQTSFAFAKTAWFRFTFLGSEGWPRHSGSPSVR